MKVISMGFDEKLKKKKSKVTYYHENFENSNEGISERVPIILKVTSVLHHERPFNLGISLRHKKTRKQNNF